MLLFAHRFHATNLKMVRLFRQPW